MSIALDNDLDEYTSSLRLAVDSIKFPLKSDVIKAAGKKKKQIYIVLKFKIILKYTWINVLCTK